MPTKITKQELAKHHSKENLWVAIEGKVYDVTNFQTEHPGGASMLNKVAGTDATKHFLKFHPVSVLRMLDSSQFVGELEDGDEELPTLKIVKEQSKPDLGEIYNLFDFESVARHTMEKTGWYYYSSGADDEMSLRENHRAFQRIWFRPKILIDVSNVDFCTEIFGKKVNSPFYITATALGKLGHPEGESILTQAAHRYNIPQMISTLSSCSIDEIMATAKPEQQVWMQIYVNADREVTRKFIEHAESLGVAGFFVTVDAPQLGRREKDMRSKYDADLADVQGDTDADREQGAARAISSFIDPGLSWKDVPFLLQCTSKPIFLKGIQRYEDAVKAATLGFSGCVLSNHGGRQLEFSRSAIEVLAEVMPELRKRSLDKKFDVFIDGGVRRGTDVLKALCLGAKAVGLGRPFLYAMSTYGLAGVNKAIRLLNEEIEMNMRLLGVTKLSELDSSLVDINHLSSHDLVDYTTEQVYERLLQPQVKHRM